MRLLVVLGMHRSGTSALSALLTRMGVDMGPEEDLLPPAPDNPVGFFENRELYTINRHLLSRLGGTWSSPPLIPTGWLEDEGIEDIRSRGSNFLAKMEERTDDWFAVKDPRLCLTLPFWENIHPIEQAVHVIRHPFDVASSLQKRNGFDLDTGIRLWLRYVSAVHFSSPDAMRVSYDELVDDTSAVAGRLARALDLEVPSETAQSEVVRSELRHAHASDPIDSDAGHVARLLYADLLRSEGPGEDVGSILRMLGQPGMGLMSHRDLSHMKERAQDLTEQLREVRAEAERSDSSLEDLRAQLGTAEERSRSAEADYRELRSTFDKTTDQVASLVEKLGETQDSLLQAHSQAAEGQETVLRARGEAREHKRRLKSSEKKARDLKEKLRDEEVKRKALSAQYSNLRRRRSVRLALKIAGLGSPIKTLRQRRTERDGRERLENVANQALPQPANFEPRSPSFQTDLARSAEQILGARYDLDPERFDAVEVSVILPTYNRRRLLPSAIRSVLSQSHENWELIIVDDGSTDGSREAVSELIDDKRIRWISVPNGGVSAARNTGLEHADGKYIAYLDSDNRWTKRHLRSMVVALETEGASAGYTALNAETIDGDYLYTRGASFDWDECRAANYVDMNVFVHRRDLLEGHDRFQTQLKRMVDWELILRVTRGENVQYVPVLGCRYRDHEGETRISTGKPMAFDAVLKTRIPEDGSPALPWPEVARQLSLTFALKIPAPEHKKAEWGDYHFAVSLGRALEDLGHEVRIDFLGEWDDAGYADVNLVLRGLTPFAPVQGSLNLMWNISHADKLSIDEYRDFDIVYTASESYARLLQHQLEAGAAVRYLPQATDSSRFHPDLAETEGIPHHPVLFVGNSRKEYRDIVKWAIEEGLDPAVYGTNWSEFIPEESIKGPNIPNEELGRYYAGADVVLNDHWPSMRDFGFVSNRVFDVLATGTPLISDRSTALARMFGSAVAQVSSSSEMEGAVDQVRDSDLGEELSEYVLQNHTFRHRAEVIADDLLEELGLDRAHGTQTGRTIPAFGSKVDSSPPEELGLVVTYGSDGPQSSAFIRLINPLTQEAVVDGVRIREIDAADPDRVDVAIVQRTSIPVRDQADAFLSHIRDQSSRLVIDVDDAFLRIDSSHPEYERYVRKNEALELLLQEADQAWFSTPRLAELYSHAAPDDVRIMRNTLDPRHWRTYRRRTDPTPQRGGPTRLLYMGTATHDNDFVMVRDALLELSGSFDFTLTVIGALRHPPRELPWLDIVDVPQGIGVYPQFVRWLREQPAFDVGVSPLAPNGFNEAKSDIKFLDYSALGLASVLSEGPAYQEAIDKDMAVGAGPEEWADALESVLSDVQAHRGMAEAASDYVWSERSAEHSALRMAEALNDLKKGQE